MATEYGKRLTQARKHAKLTQAQLGKAVGVGQSAIGGLEKIGHGSAYTYQIATATGVSPAWLATGEGDMLGAEVRQPPRRHSIYGELLADYFDEMIPPGSVQQVRAFTIATEAIFDFVQQASPHNSPHAPGSAAKKRPG